MTPDVPEPNEVVGCGLAELKDCVSAVIPLMPESECGGVGTTQLGFTGFEGCFDSKKACGRGACLGDDHEDDCERPGLAGSCSRI